MDVNGCRQNESPNSWKSHSSPSVNILWSEKLVFLRNKSIIKMFLTSNCCFRVKYESIIHNIVKVVSSESGEKYAQIKHRLQAKTVQNCFTQICWVILMWEDIRGWTFSLKEALYELWTCILIRSDGLKLKCLNEGFVSYKHSFFLHKMLTDGLDLCGLLVDYCDVFISCLDSHSDGTHSLQSIHCEQVMECYISPNLMKKQTHLHLERPEGEYLLSKFFIFGWTISLTYRQLLKIPILQNIPFWLMTLHLWSECLLSC